MIEAELFLQLFWVFFIIGLFTFGGGYAMPSLIQASNLVAILGSATATLAVILPSFLIVLTIVKFYTKFKNNKKFETVMSWLRPAVVGLIGAAALILIFNVSWSGMPLFSHAGFSVIQENFCDWKSWVLFAAAVMVSLFSKVNPILIIIGGGIAGFLLY